MAKQLTEETREIVIRMHDNNLSLRKISKIANISYGTVQLIVSKHAEENTTMRKWGTGRPSKLSANVKTVLIDSAISDPIKLQLNMQKK